MLTGATGSLGLYVLASLLHNDSVQSVYCLGRSADAGSRVKKALARRGLTGLPIGKAVFIEADLAEDKLGLSEWDFNRLLEATAVIHVRPHVSEITSVLIVH